MNGARTIYAWLSSLLGRREDGPAGDPREQARQLHALFVATASVAERWHMPFPMGVFGTLRAGLVNNRLMHRGRVAMHRRAFLPHFCANGVQLTFRPGASAPCEIFFYEPRQWRKMIRRVDRLEDFRPGQAYVSAYQRTLAWLRLLPQDFHHPAYEAEQLGSERDLQLSVTSWDHHEAVPCWIYSSVEQNRIAARDAMSPLIWDGMAIG